MPKILRRQEVAFSESEIAKVLGLPDGVQIEAAELRRYPKADNLLVLTIAVQTDMTLKALAE